MSSADALNAYQRASNRLMYLRITLKLTSEHKREERELERAVPELWQQYQTARSEAE